MHYVGFCNFQPFMKKICTGFLLQNPTFMNNSFTLFRQIVIISLSGKSKV